VIAPRPAGPASRWGALITISGDDIFRLEASGLIYAHESAWDQEPGKLAEALVRPVSEDSLRRGGVSL
jgi:hypothetical protein